MLSPEGKILRHEDAGVFCSGMFLFPEGRRSKMKTSGNNQSSLPVKTSKRKMSSEIFKPFRLLSAMILILSTSLSACGGGSSGGGAPTATLSGTVTDSPVAGATVYFTSGAPYGLTGAKLLGKTTADSSGNYSITINPPSGTTPVFVTGEGTISGQSVQLSSFVGSGGDLSGTLSSSNLPSLNPTQVTTSSLLTYQQNNGGNYSNITPSTYYSEIQNLQTQIIDLAAIIQAVVDNQSGCTLSSGNSPTLSNLVSLVSGSSSISATTNILNSAAASISSSCSTTDINNNIGVIQGNPTYVSQLSSNPTSVQSTGSLPTGVSSGTYTGIINAIQTGCSSSSCGSNSSNSFEAQFTLSSGKISFTGNVQSGENNGTGTGTLTGSNFTMSITPSGTGVTSASASGVLQAGVNGEVTVNGTYQETDTNSGTSVTYYSKFNGTFYPGTTLPANIPVPSVNTNSSSSSSLGFTCTSGTPFFLGGPNDQPNNPLYSLGIPVCITGTTKGFTMTFPTSNIPCLAPSGTTCAKVPSALLPGSTLTFTQDQTPNENGIFTSGQITTSSYEFGLNYIAGTNDIVLTFCSIGTPASTGLAQCSSSGPTAFTPGSTNPNVSNGYGWNITNVMVNGGVIMN